MAELACFPPSVLAAAKEKAEELEEFQEPAGDESEQEEEPKAKRRKTDKQVKLRFPLLYQHHNLDTAVSIVTFIYHLINTTLLVQVMYLSTNHLLSEAGIRDLDAVLGDIGTLFSFLV